MTAVKNFLHFLGKTGCAHCRHLHFFKKIKFASLLSWLFFLKNEKLEIFVFFWDITCVYGCICGHFFTKKWKYAQNSISSILFYAGLMICVLKSKKMQNFSFFKNNTMFSWLFFHIFRTKKYFVLIPFSERIFLAVLQYFCRINPVSRSKISWLAVTPKFTRADISL